MAVVLSPTSQTDYAGSTATFSVSAIGPGTFSYQWQEEWQQHCGRTGGTLALAGISDANAGIYSAIVSNAFGSVTTSNAALTVNDNLFIASQPQSQTVSLGGSAAFNATAYGAPPFVFQWYFNGSPVGSAGVGSSVAPLVLTNIAANQAGNYWVEVVNADGSQSSQQALLTVVVLTHIDAGIVGRLSAFDPRVEMPDNSVVQYSTNLPRDGLGKVALAVQPGQQSVPCSWTLPGPASPTVFTGLSCTEHLNGGAASRRLNAGEWPGK